MEAISSPSQIDTSLFAGYAAGAADSVLSRNIVERVVPETESGSRETYTNHENIEDDYDVNSYRKVEREPQDPQQVKTDERRESSQQDLNEYYSKLAAADYVPSDYSHADPVATASSGVKQSAANLQNAMIEAVQKGMSIEHACNIRSAKAAYEANIRALKTTIEISA